MINHQQTLLCDHLMLFLESNIQLNSYQPVIETVRRAEANNVIIDEDFIQQIKNQLDSNKYSLFAYCLYAYLYLKIQDYNAVESYLNKVIVSKSNYQLAHFIFAKSSLPNQAILTYQKVIELTYQRRFHDKTRKQAIIDLCYSLIIDCYIQITDTYYSENAFKHAIDKSNEAIGFIEKNRIKPSQGDVATLYLRRGQAKLNLENKDYDSARRDLEHALKIDDKQIYAAYTLVLLYNKQGNYDLTIKYCTFIVDFINKTPTSQYNLAFCKKAILPWLYIYYGDALSKLDRNQEAIDVYSLAIRQNNSRTFSITPEIHNRALLITYQARVQLKILVNDFEGAKNDITQMVILNEIRQNNYQTVTSFQPFLKFLVPLTTYTMDRTFPCDLKVYQSHEYQITLAQPSQQKAYQFRIFKPQTKKVENNNPIPYSQSTSSMSLNSSPSTSR